MSSRAPQASGVPGWLFLSHSEDGQAHALFVDAKGQRQEAVRLVLDERLCCDTIFRVVRLSKLLFVVADVLWFNGLQIHDKTTFVQRETLIRDLVVTFHVPDFAALILPNDLPVGTLLRGHEYYDDNPGTSGVFLPTTT